MTRRNSKMREVLFDWGRQKLRKKPSSPPKWPGIVESGNQRGLLEVGFWYGVRASPNKVTIAVWERSTQTVIGNKQLHCLLRFGCPFVQIDWIMR